ncbi:MAG: RNA polymerase factor sigma-54 [Bacteroidales bacterium]|nr:RNA polymerase factor sigma-54 [Bacteroidales bacterium]
MSGMRLGMDLSMRPELKQFLAPRMIQSMEILQLPVMALQEKIQAELQENPFLEIQEARAKSSETASTEEFNPDAPLKHDDSGDLEFHRLEELNRDWEDHFNEDHRPSRHSLAELSDKKLDAMQNVASAPISLQDHLTEQLAYMDLTPEEWELCAYLISHLDDNGYLLGHDRDRNRLIPITLQELAANFPQGPVIVEDIEAALIVVQSLDPAGVGARDTKECLLLQVTDDTAHKDLVRTLIRDHLEDIAHNRLPIIQRKTHADIPTIQEAIEELRRFDPKPGTRFVPQNNQYVVPDIIVERTDSDDFDIRLTDDWTPPVRISKRYVDLAKDKSYDPKTRDFLKQKFTSAHWLIDAIEQRRNTLIKVTRSIILHQRAFLDLGPDYIQPLKMEEIAKQVGVHVTTVSRAVDDKWVQTPRGVFPLKRFFGGGTKNEQTGENVAWETIKQKLLEIISSEDKAHPFSDEDIVERFKQAGLTIARRTVTKYREALKIPSSRQRKDWSQAR